MKDTPQKNGVTPRNPGGLRAFQRGVSLGGKGSDVGPQKVPTHSLKLYVCVFPFSLRKHKRKNYVLFKCK